MQDVKEEVRARLNIEDVIGEYVSLKRAGRNFKGLSPFGSEKTPSFFVSPEKHIWHDFSSNKGGDVFSFVMEVEGLDFKGALELLARKAGVDMSMYQGPAQKGLARRKARLLSLLELAATYYQHSLIKNQHALEYVFKKRCLNKTVVGDFRIGYAPSSGSALMSFLLKKGYSSDEIKAAGLSAERRGGVGDMFRGRMMVPLCDGQGQVIGFTARILEDVPGAPKYINTPATILYDKSRHVFGLHQAKEAIRQADAAVIVEGNLDVISSHQAGIKQVVATAGTAITEQHLKILSRLSGQVRLAFDGDKAGLAATERAIPIAQSAGVTVGVVRLPAGAKDPDDLLQKDPKSWAAAIEAAEPVVDWVLGEYTGRYDIQSAEGKRLFSDAALKVVVALRDAVEKEHYMKKIAGMLDTSPGALERKLAGLRGSSNAAAKKSVKAEASTPDTRAYQDTLLALAVMDIAVRELLDNLDEQQLDGPARQTLQRYLLDHRDAQLADPLPAELHEVADYVKILLLKADARYAAWSEQDRFAEAAKLVRLCKQQHIKQKKGAMTDELRQAEASRDDAAAETLRTQLNKLIKEQPRGTT